MFFLNRRPGGFAEKGNPLQNRKQRLFRGLMLLIVFVVVAISFSINSEKRIRKILIDTAGRIDYTGELSTEEENRLRLYQEKFFRAYGVKIQIRIENGPPDERPAKEAGMVFLGLDPAARESAFYAPPLAAAVLGPDLADRLEGEFFKPYFEKNEWPRGLAAALEEITRKLDAGLKAGRQDHKADGSRARSVLPGRRRALGKKRARRSICLTGA